MAAGEWVDRPALPVGRETGKPRLPGVGQLGQLLRAQLTEEGSHHRVLTGMRGWAALWVFAYHVWGYAWHPQLTVPIGDFSLDLTPFFSMGGAGVSIFFALSGFLLALPFAEWQAGLRARPQLGPYLLRRVLRVLPAYYAQLLILILIAYWVPGEPGIQGPASIFRHLLMLFTPPPLGTAPINDVWWTLPIEFSFYLVLPFLAFLLRPGRGWLLLAGSLAAMYLWRYGVTIQLADARIQERVIAAYQLPGSMDMFGIGMVTSLLYVNRDQIPGWLLPRDGELLAWLGLLLIIASIYWLPGRRHEYWTDSLIFYTWTPSLALGVGSLILSGMDGTGLARRLFANRFMVFAGLISYSCYLWHYPIVRWIAGWYQGAHGAYSIWFLLLMSAPAVLAVSTLSYILIERPFMRLRRGRVRP